jgi:hypothetical protein
MVDTCRYQFQQQSCLDTGRLVPTPKFRIKAAGCHGRPASLACFDLPNHGFSLTGVFEELWGKRQPLIWKRQNNTDDQYTPIHAPSYVAACLYQHRAPTALYPPAHFTSAIGCSPSWLGRAHLHQQTWPPVWMARPVSRSPSECALLLFARLRNLRGLTMVPFSSEMDLSRERQLRT